MRSVSQSHFRIATPEPARAHLRAPGDLASTPLPARPIADPGNAQVTHTFCKREDHVEVRTAVKDHVYQTIVDYAFGSGDRGLTLVGHDPEARPFEYRLSHYAETGSWLVTTGQPEHPDQPALYQGMRSAADAVRRCLVCHTTNAHAILTALGAESSDRAIGCERCHGPGGHHVLAIASKRTDPAIARPKLVHGAPIVALCSQCHSPRDKEMKLAPGTVESVRFQGTTFTWSRCFLESGNKLDCVTCHDPHKNVETAASWYEARCWECHSAADQPAKRAPQHELRSPRDAGASCPINPAGNCVSCHMPKIRVPMAYTRFTDHWIRADP